MLILGVGTAAPEQRYTQLECWEALREQPRFQDLTARSQALLRRVLAGNSGIVTRHLALEHLEDAFSINPDVLHERFARHAPALAEQAALSALQRAGASARDVDALLVSTCTGYLCPGLTSYVSERLGLKPSTFLLDLVGQGCGAAIPNLRVAESLISGGGAEIVLSVCVEVCSAAMYLDDDPGVLISACIFGDGAGALVLGKQAPRGKPVVRWRGSDTLLSAADRDLLRFEQRSGLLRNILSPQVPAAAANFVAAVLDQRLARNGVQRADIKSWLFHPGGREVLSSICQRLGLESTDVRFSAEVLREYGNVSSPSVFFVLERALAAGLPPGCSWMSSFGAGFSCHGALIEAA